MRVCFLLNDLGLAGGVGVVVQHAHQLSTEHGMEVVLGLCGEDAERWQHRRLEGVRVAVASELRGEEFDIAIATWWRTAYRLFEIRARRYAYFVQSMEDRFYEWPAVERLEASVTYTLPVAFLTEARWIRDLLAQLVPGAQVHYVRNGVDKEVFAPVERVEPLVNGPLRILLEGHPEVWFKGIGESIRVLEGVQEPYEATLVTSAAGFDAPAAITRVVGPLSQEEMAQEYDRHHVMLKMSRVEGMYGPPLEAFHRGATVVTTPVTGHDEYVEHGWNGLVADWDDLRGTSRYIDLLARDRRLLHRLRSNALETARSWPDWSQAGNMMAGALHAIADGPAPDPRAGAVRMLADVAAAAMALSLDRATLASDVELYRRNAGIYEELAERYRQEVLEKGDELWAVIDSERWRLGGDMERMLQRRWGRIARQLAIGRHRRMLASVKGFLRS